MILIAPDKFKGSLSAREAAEIIAGAFRSRGLEDLLLCPMADGGEGTPRLLGTPPDGVPVILSHDHAGPQSFPDVPFADRSSFALGVAVRKAHRKGRKIYIGLGGTAVCDGGAGFLQALGVRFRDIEDKPIAIPVTTRMLPCLGRAEGLEELRAKGYAADLEALYDVEASLLPGDEGLSAIDFVGQKGAGEEDIPLLLSGLANLRGVLGADTESPCDGAAGGIGFAICSAVGAQARAGARAVLDSYRIDWSAIDMVVSGEGRIDSQSAGGKVPCFMEREARRHGLPCVLIGGYVEESLRSDLCVGTIERKEEYDTALAAGKLRATAEKVADLARQAIKKR